MKNLFELLKPCAGFTAVPVKASFWQGSLFPKVVLRRVTSSRALNCCEAIFLQLTSSSCVSYAWRDGRYSILCFYLFDNSSITEAHCVFLCFVSGMTLLIKIHSLSALLVLWVLWVTVEVWLVQVFICEQKLYTRTQLEQHLVKGDSKVDGTQEERAGFTGHPMCEFCRKRFYGENELYAHMSTEHYTCHFCQR